MILKSKTCKQRPSLQWALRLALCATASRAEQEPSSRKPSVRRRVYSVAGGLQMWLSYGRQNGHHRWRASFQASGLEIYVWSCGYVRIRGRYGCQRGVDVSRRSLEKGDHSAIWVLPILSFCLLSYRILQILTRVFVRISYQRCPPSNYAVHRPVLCWLGICSRSSDAPATPNLPSLLPESLGPPCSSTDHSLVYTSLSLCLCFHRVQLYLVQFLVGRHIHGSQLLRAAGRGANG